MTVIELDSRFPTVIPLEAASLLTGEVSYTEEVPIRVRWAIADAGGHSVSDADILVTTDPENDEVLDRLERGDNLIRAGLDTIPNPSSVEVPAQSTTAHDRNAPVSDMSATPEEAPGSTVTARISSTSSAEPNKAAAGAQALPHVVEAVAVMAKARRTGDWEASQTHVSLLRYLLEETYEFIDAVNGDGDIRSELADLFLQVLFHAEIAEDFDLDDVAAEFLYKMRVRQPYLFDGSLAEGETVSVDKQEAAWAEGREKPRSDPAEFLPALALAEEVIRRARAEGVPDSEIPMDLLCPTPGLELESGAEERTRKAAREFLAKLSERTARNSAFDNPDAQ